MIAVTGLPYSVGDRVTHLSSPIPPNVWRVGTVHHITVRLLPGENEWDVVYFILLDEPLNRGRHQIDTAVPENMKPLAQIDLLAVPPENPAY